MIQSGVLRIFRMAMRGLCSPSALLAFPSAPSAHLPAHLPAYPAASPVLAVSSFRLFGSSLRPSARPPIRPVPSASSLRLSALSDSRLFLYPLRSSRPLVLTFLSAPACPPACPRFVSPLIRVRPLRPLRPPAPPVPLRSRRILFRRFRTVLCFFVAGCFFAPDF